MTAMPHSPMTACARTRLRGRPLFGGALVVVAILQLLMLVVPPFGGRALAEERVKGEVRVSTDGGYARLVFRFEKEVPASIQVTDSIMVVTFKQPVALSVDRLSGGASDYINAARIDPDGRSVRIALVHKVKVDSIPAAEQLFIDLLPETWSGMLPGLPRETIENLAKRALDAERQLRVERITVKAEKKPAAVRVKVATQPTFTRYVFAMPDLANVLSQNANGKLTLEFDQPINWDLSDARVAMPPTLRSIDNDPGDDSTTVTFIFNGDPQVRTFREDRSIVIDVSHDRGKPKAAEQNAKPKDVTKQQGALGVAPPETVPVKDAAAAPPLNADSAPPPANPAAEVAPPPKADNTPPPVMQATAMAPPMVPAPPAVKPAAATEQPIATAPPPEKAAERTPALVPSPPEDRAPPAAVAARSSAASPAPKLAAPRASRETCSDCANRCRRPIRTRPLSLR